MASTCREIPWICKLRNRVKSLLMVHFGRHACDCSVVLLGTGVVCNKCPVTSARSRGEGFGAASHHVTELN